MNFHLKFPVPALTEKINYNHSFLFMGSCFAENIGSTMEKYKFKLQLNPSGIVYNPASISIALQRYLADCRMEDTELFYENEVWSSWEHHSYFSSPDKSIALGWMNSGISLAHRVIKRADWLFITFGSAYYYKRKDTGIIVSNCHKVPQKEFTKHLLSAEEIVKDYTTLFSKLKEANPGLKIVFTVSPVRYIRDGVIENNRSKAILIESIHQLKERHPNVLYFPAYELVMDDLRDYRFFKEDLVHPTSQAIDYVFEKFIEAAFSKEARLIYDRLTSIINDYNHRPLNSKSDAFKKFRTSYRNRAMALETEFPFLDLKEYYSTTLEEDMEENENED